MADPVKWAAWNFANADQVLVAFRVLGSRKHEHWLNRAAVALTASRRSKHGKMCHVELMMQPQPGVWMRFGIVKKSYIGNDAKGRPLFQKGVVHAKVVDTSSWDSKYVFLSMSVSRAKQKNAFDFLMSQVGGPFNFNAYVLNAFVPHGVGVGQYHPRLHDDKHAWFCAQLVGTALQAMSDDETMDLPYVAPAAQHAVRLMWVLLALAVGALLGAATFELVARASALGRTVAGLLCALAALLGASATEAAIVAVGDSSSARAAHYRSLTERHDAARASWRAAVGEHTRWHQSNPNSMYDMLVDKRGVVFGRDPHGACLSLA